VATHSVVKEAARATVCTCQGDWNFALHAWLWMHV
jgi:hypothetical protein